MNAGRKSKQASLPPFLPRFTLSHERANETRRQPSFKAAVPRIFHTPLPQKKEHRHVLPYSFPGGLFLLNERAGEDFIKVPPPPRPSPRAPLQAHSSLPPPSCMQSLPPAAPLHHRHPAATTNSPAPEQPKLRREEGEGLLISLRGRGEGERGRKMPPDGLAAATMCRRHPARPTRSVPTRSRRPAVEPWPE